MKLINKLMLGAGVLLLSANAMAKMPQCPSVADIQQYAQFTKATPCADSDKNYWCMVSNNFNYDNAQWNIAMLADIQAKNNNDALRVGQDFFSTKISLNDPEAYGDDEQAVCLYALKDYEYAVAAFSPPVQLPGSELNSIFKRK